jgi:hypothetical protein
VTVVPAYKQLEAKTRIADLTLGQWVGVVAGVLCALVVIAWLKPIGTYANLVLGVYLGGIPITISLVVSVGEFDVWLLVRAAWRWCRADGRYGVGSGSTARGYQITGTESAGASIGATAVELQHLWESPANGRPTWP